MSQTKLINTDPELPHYGYLITAYTIACSYIAQ